MVSVLGYRQRPVAGRGAFAALVFAVLTSLVAVGMLRAAVPTPSVQPYQQNFDSLIASGSTGWQNNATLNGWYAAGGTTGLNTITAYNNTPTPNLAGGLYSFGATGDSDRSLGVVGSSTNTPKRIGFVFKNTSGSRIKRLMVTYTGKQWFDGNTDPVVERLQFKYKKAATNVALGAADIQLSTGFTNYPPLDFVSPQNAGVGPINGNDPANSATVSSMIELRPDLGPNQEMMFVWEKDNAPGNDDGLAIDNLSITPGFGVALPVANCPATLTTFQGSPVSSQVSSFDPNGTVVQAQIVSGASGITLANAQPATALGGSFTADLQVDGTQAIGNYPVVIQFTSQELNETKRCTTTVLVRDTTDLAVAKDGPASYKPGEQALYVVTVNSGGSTAFDVNVVDTLPAGVTYVSDNSGVTPVRSGQTVTWTFPTLIGQKVIAVTTSVSASTTGPITNQVNVTTTSQDPDTANNTASVTTAQYVPAPSFASSSKTVSATTVQVGQTFTYTLAVNNDGDADGTFNLSDTLPANVTLLAAPGMTQQGQQLTATGVISGGDQLQYSVSVRATALGTVANVATLSGDGTTRTLTAPVVTVVAQATPPNFSTSTKTVDKRRISRGEQVVYTISVTNSGQQSGNFTLTDQLDPQLTLVSAPGMTVNGRTVTATGSVGAGLSQQYTIIARATPTATLGSTIANTATLTGDGQTRTLQAPAVTVVPAAIFVPLVQK